LLKYLELGRVKTLRPNLLNEPLMLLKYLGLGGVETPRPEVLKQY
jgi:hypothetical protein